MADDTRSEFTRPIPLTLVIVAVIGWVIAIWALVSSNTAEQDYTTQITALEEERTAAVTALEEQEAAAGDLAAIEAEVAAAETRLSEAEAGAEEMTERAQSLEEEIAASEERLAALEADLSEQQATYTERQQEIDEWREAIEAGRAELTNVENQLAERTQEVSDVGARLESLRAEEAETRDTLAALTEEAAQRSEEAAQAEARIQEAREAEAAAREQIAALEEQLQALEAQVEAAREQITPTLGAPAGDRTEATDVDSTQAVPFVVYGDLPPSGAPDCRFTADGWVCEGRCAEFDDWADRVVELDEVLYFVADDGQVAVETEDGRYRADFQLKELERRLDDADFFRCHRSYVVRMSAVDVIEPKGDGSYRLVMDADRDEVVVATDEGQRVAQPILGVDADQRRVRRIVERHGGTLTYERNQPHGAKFTITIPC